MANRYSGELKITVIYDDRNFYRVAIFDRPGQPAAWRGTIGPPASGFGRDIGYDSPEAYDRTAHAGLSFAFDDEPHLKDLADSNGDIRRKPYRRSEWSRR